MGANGFRWLHFSDIHVGMAGQDRVWPRSATVLLDDLETAHRKTDGFDLLVFSGDMVQRGTAAEFAAFDEVLERILGRLGELGPTPPVVTVPGNHDLVRPDSLQPAALALAQFWKQPALRDRMWDEAQPYLAFLREVFAPYSAWRARAIERGVHLTPTKEGILPGDAAFVLEAPAGRLGVAALNSTWLQLGGGDYDGKLHVDARQLLGITDKRPDDWARGNDVSLLVTHQPATWLHADSPAAWDNDVNPAGRFDLHLFGHMHEPAVTSVSHGGGPARRHIQAASLFGLETYGEGHKRIQGYSTNRIVADGGDRRLTSWPRRLIELTGGRLKLVPDGSQDIDEATGSLELPYRVERRIEVVAPAPSPSARAKTSAPSPMLDPVGLDLSIIRHPLAPSMAHHKVRRVEQQACVAALGDGRAAWLVSDWGMGEDGFIAAICGRIDVPRESVYRVDFNGFGSGEAFFDEMRTRLGVSFQEICRALSNAGRCILLLDDVEVGASPAAVEPALEALVRPVIDFAPDARVLITTRRRPRGGTFPVVELSALDEADVASYARESELGGERYAKPDAVSSLFRHTDGVPSRIDDALRDLEIISLADLLAANPDYGDATVAVAGTTTPPALVAAVGELASSGDRVEERAYNLLLALATLPQGEQLGRLTRFLGPHPFYPLHARTLLERSLIDTVTVTALEGMPGDSTRKALFVPRPVREYVRSVMDDAAAREFDRKAVSLYFGDDWAIGAISASPTGRRVSKALCDGYEIQNATALILRGLRRALVDSAELDIAAHIRLASAFIETLITGDHFRSAAALSEDVLRLLEETGQYAREVNVLRYEFARSCRMSERVPEARAAFEQLDHSMLSKEQRQSAELGLALALKRQGDAPAAKEAAERAIAIDRRSNAALQAKTIIAEAIEDRERRSAELRTLLAAARRAKSTTVTNNILLTLANLERDEQVVATLLNEVIQSPSGKHDFYNNVRAIVDLASRVPNGSSLGEADRSRLIDAYHFLYSERLVSLFDRCHAALWAEFEASGEVENLLNLFRHSSFIWRLGGRDELEAKYLAKLVGMVREVLAREQVRESRDGAYFIVRVSVVMQDLNAAKLA